VTGRHDAPPPPGPGGLRGFLASPLGLAVCLLLAAAGLYLWAEHRLHVLAALPFVAPAAICILMHVFMHARHGGHR
jgi:hypothetical protein